MSLIALNLNFVFLERCVSVFALDLVFVFLERCCLYLQFTWPLYFLKVVCLYLQLTWHLYFLKVLCLYLAFLLLESCVSVFALDLVFAFLERCAQLSSHVIWKMQWSARSGFEALSMETSTSYTLLWNIEMYWCTSITSFRFLSRGCTSVCRFAFSYYQPYAVLQEVHWVTLFSQLQSDQQWQQFPHGGRLSWGQKDKLL